MYVVAADSTSIEPSIKYSNLVFPSTTTYSTASASPSTAAATALQISTSNPNQIVPASESESHFDSEKPGKSSLVPHITCPLSITLSNVLPYVGVYSGLGSSSCFSHIFCTVRLSSIDILL